MINYIICQKVIIAIKEKKIMVKGIRSMQGDESGGAGEVWRGPIEKSTGSKDTEQDDGAKSDLRGRL